MAFIRFTDKKHEYCRNYNKTHYNPYKKKVYYLTAKLKNHIDLTIDEYTGLESDIEKYQYLFKKDCELKCASL